MMTDPVADMLTRIRNALQNRIAIVDIPHSRLKQGIAAVLQREGYIHSYEIIEEEGKPHRTLRLELKYGPDGERVIQHIRRASCPGRRIYCGVTEIPHVLQGLGICILSTSKGILSSREAKRQRVGGELLCIVW
ncbi:MAG: 30S ribosomal protein S8 [Planctomycetaceae bacterium]|nr:MAG: 30S ribosomal protein S8 [Planctomycetaceae bacterium]